MLATLTIQQEALPLVKAGVEMKRRVLELGLRRYQARLTSFEEQYRMTSGQFAARFGAGELGDDADWFEWEFVLDAYRETQQQLELLDDIRL